MSHNKYDLNTIIRGIQKTETSNPWLEKLAVIVAEIHKDMQESVIKELEGLQKDIKELKIENGRLKARVYEAERHFTR